MTNWNKLTHAPIEELSERRQIARTALRKGCTKCGETHLLEFHHRDSSTKLFNIGDPKMRKRSPEDFRREVAKCDVLCQECHIIVHGFSKRKAKTLNYGSPDWYAGKKRHS